MTMSCLGSRLRIDSSIVAHQNMIVHSSWNYSLFYGLINLQIIKTNVGDSKGLFLRIIEHAFEQV